MLAYCYGVVDILLYIFQASCVYDEYRYVMACEGAEVEAYWEPNRLVARVSRQTG